MPQMPSQAAIYYLYLCRVAFEWLRNRLEMWVVDGHDRSGAANPVLKHGVDVIVCKSIAYNVELIHRAKSGLEYLEEHEGCDLLKGRLKLMRAGQERATEKLHFTVGALYKQLSYTAHLTCSR